MKKTLLAGSITALLFSCTTEQKEMTDTIAFTPPTTETCDSVDVYFGDTVPDPYQWLEDDYSKKTNAWVSKQSKATEAYLAQIPQRENIRKRLTQVWNYEKYSVPFRKKGATYLFKNDGIQNQSVLYQVADDGTEELVLDPNTFSEDGTVALGSVALSKNGKLLGYSTSKSGSDWNTIQVMDLESKRVYITSQNHGFAVEDPEQGMLAPHPSGACSEKGKNVLGADFKVRYINSNDRTVEGLDLVGKSSFTVQFHPEARPGPLDAAPLFDRFSDIVNKKIPTNKIAKTLRGDN